MKEKYFVSTYFEEAIDEYQKLLKNNSLEESCDFSIIVLRILFFIYGELDFLNPKITNDAKSVYRNMTKFGYSSSDVMNFFKKFNDYNYMIKNNLIDRYNLKNGIQKDLIEMFFYKQAILNLNESEINKMYQFLNQLNSEDGKDYFKTKLCDIKLQSNQVEYLEVESTFIENVENDKIVKNKDRMAYASGFTNIIVILSVIALVCFGIVVINLLVG